MRNVRRSIVVIVCLSVGGAVLVEGCGPFQRGPAHGRGDADVRTDEAPSPAPKTPTVSPEPLPASGSFLPEPDRGIPASAPAIASEVARTTRALRRSIRAWIRTGDLSRPSPRAVVLEALYQQRIYRVLGRAHDLARRVVSRLPEGIASEVRINVSAMADLFSIVAPVRRPRVPLRTQAPLPAGTLAADYREAQDRFGVSWAVLAAVNFVESKFGRVRTASPAGARGPMQFLPSTWAAYGLGGDIDDPRDAIMGAANYLRASGAPDSYRRALYAYNHSVPYVNAVLAYAHQMQRHPETFLEYYNWQVFAVTPSGDRRLTGPGLG
jgi:membrane-bound lytic murein transglycosylase B